MEEGRRDGERGGRGGGDRRMEVHAIEEGANYMKTMVTTPAGVWQR